MKRLILTCIAWSLFHSVLLSQGFFRLHWYDEFDGNTLDPDKWEHQTGTGASEGLTDWGNWEQQYYTPENTTVKGGMLVIRARRETKENKPFTSSRLFTRGKFSTTYGRIEARIRISQAVEGLWPAFWMLPHNSPYGTWAASGEIDIFEGKGRLPREYSGAIHYGGEWPRNTYVTTGNYTFPDEKTLEDFHLYALEWKEGKLAWYCDDILVKKISQWHSEKGPFPAPFDSDFFILLNFAVGGTFDESRVPPANFSSAEMHVDYVRVYKWDDTLSEPELPENSSGNIRADDTSGISISQTPDQITIHADQEIRTAHLYSANGKLCFSAERSNRIKTSDLDKGVYVLTVQNQKGQTKSFKVLLK